MVLPLLHFEVRNLDELNFNAEGDSRSVILVEFSGEKCKEFFKDKLEALVRR